MLVEWPGQQLEFALVQAHDLRRQPGLDSPGLLAGERKCAAVFGRTSDADPPRDKTCNGRVRFSWQTSYGLQSGEVFEIHIWPDYKQRRDKIQQTRSSSMVLDLRRDVPWIDWNNRAHFWEVAVICQANGRWISQESGARLFYFDSRIQVDEGNPDNNCR